MKEERQYSPHYGTQSGTYSRDNFTCIDGHEFTESNTRWVRRKSRNTGFPDRWSRQCKTCANKANKRYRERKAIMKAYNEALMEASKDNAAR
mgnify:CR=1 FL=1